jgi:hypothetical protein
MTLRDQPVTDAEASRRLSLWLALAAFVAYWWFLARATRSLLRSASDLGRWFREWREEDRRWDPGVWRDVEEARRR